MFSVMKFLDICNILLNYNLNYNDRNHVNNIIFTYAIIRLILKYNTLFEKWLKKHCANSEENIEKN